MSPDMSPKLHSGLAVADGRHHRPVCARLPTGNGRRTTHAGVFASRRNRDVGLFHRFA
jgi:hypothetical protein